LPVLERWARGYFSHEVPEMTGVMKAFSTCVGEGRLRPKSTANWPLKFRETSFEYGASTGRARGASAGSDAVASRYGAEVSGGATEIALTKLDSLSGLETLEYLYRLPYRSLHIGKFPHHAGIDSG